jgi:muramoyltetrapeptide carboxypeptidase
MKPYQLPKPIQPGATLGIIAPASAAKRKSVAAGITYLKARGFKIRMAPNLSRRLFYLAGNDELRTTWLEQFVLDPKIDGIICVRGGYGLLRILDKIDYHRLAAVPPKILVGYSDITSLQMAFLNKLGWISYSGPMVASDMGPEFSPFSEQWFWKMLLQHPYPIELQNPSEQPLRVFHHGKASGTLLGGCFSLITPILNTAYMPELKGAILVLEDIGEKTYHLDKQFQILKLQGIFEKISGLILGQFSKCFPKNPTRSFTLDDYLRDFLKGYDFPVISNFAYGHVKERFTLPFGVKASLRTDPPGILLHGDAQRLA